MKIQIQETLRYRIKVGRAVHCAPVWVVLTRLPGWNPTVRALTGAATTRATLQGRSKSRVFEGKALSKPAAVCARAMPNFGRRGSRVNQSNQKRCWSTALQKLLLQSFTVEAQRIGRARSPLRAGVGRADPASRFESGFPRPYGRGYGAERRAPLSGAQKTCGQDGRAPTPQ